MDWYSIALFLHVVGALGFFVVLGLEWAGLVELQRSTTVEQIRDVFKRSKSMRGIGGISILLILGAGFYMAAVAWGGAMWVAIALATIVLMVIFGAFVGGPQQRALQKAVANENGAITPEIANLLYHPALWISMWTRVGLSLGIIYLMTVKPALVGSLVAIVVSGVLGLALSMLTTGSKRRQVITA